MTAPLDVLLTEDADDRISRFIWLRQFEVGRNSADMNRLLDRLEFLQKIELPDNMLDGIPPHRISRLRRQGERYFTDGLRDITSDRRLAILAVCALEWRTALADTVVETHDRIVGKTWRDAKRLCDDQIAASKSSLHDTLRSFSGLGGALLEAHKDSAPLDDAVETACGWHDLEALVAMATRLTSTMAADSLAHVAHGYNRFRRYAPRMLRALRIKAAPVAEPLIAAAWMIRDGQNTETRPTAFLRRSSKWHRHLNAREPDDNRLWEVAVLSHLRDASRSGDIWLEKSRRYADLKQTLVPITAAQASARLAVPFDPAEWIADRRQRMADGLSRLARAARTGAIPGGSIVDGVLKVDRLSTAVPEAADDLVLDLYKSLPTVRITDILLEVDDAVGFADAFTHLRTGAPCKDRIGLLSVLLAEGLNLGLSKMADATSTHDYFQLSRLSRWHIESEAINKALAMVIDACYGDRCAGRAPHGPKLGRRCHRVQ